MTPLRGLPTETIRRLCELDPAADSRKVSPEVLRTIRERITADPLRDPGGEPDQRLVPVDRHPGSTPAHIRMPLVLTALVVAIIALVIGASVVLTRSHGSGPPEAAAPVGTKQSPSDLIRLTNPLAAGRQVDCGDLAAPVEALTQPGTAEEGTSESSLALRAFLANNPWAGMGSVSGKDWLKLGETDQMLVFGQRTGSVGIGPVVTFRRSDGGWHPAGLGGCGRVVPGLGEQAVHIDGATLTGHRLQLTWENGTCGKDLDRTLVRTETMVSASGLHLLLVTRENPAVPKARICVGVGTTSTASVTLTAPVAAVLARGVYDDAFLPAGRVQLS